MGRAERFLSSLHSASDTSRCPTPPPFSSGGGSPHPGLLPYATGGAGHQAAVTAGRRSGPGSQTPYRQDQLPSSVPAFVTPQDCGP